MLRILIIAGLCSAATAASTEPDGDAKAMLALPAYVQCLQKAARSYDDGASDARTVAIAIVTLCKEQKIALYLTNPNITYGEAERLLLSERDHNADEATLVVLGERVSKKTGLR